MGGWSSLLMGIANRAAEVNRQEEQRKYDEGLASKHLQSKLLIDKLGDINSTDEERRSAAQAFESLHKIKTGTLTDSIIPMAKQVYDRVVPMIPPTEPTGPVGIGARTGQSMPTLGQLPTPPKHTQIPLSNREATRRQEMSQFEAEDRIDAAVRGGVLTPAEGVMEKKGLLTNRGALSLMGLASKEDIAKANLQMKQLQLLTNANAAYGAPVLFRNKDGQIKMVHMTKAGLSLTPKTDSEGNMVMGENNLPVMEQFNAGTEWQPVEKGVVTATDDKGNVTAQTKGNMQVASMGGTPPPAQPVVGLKGKPAATPKTTSGLTPNQQATRADRSFALMNKNLENIGKPVRERAERLDRVLISIKQNSPAADSLIAPELLTAMAGGLNSGLRMTEAEIGRIVGGRSAWQSLKAAINKWSLDTSKALSLPAEQKAQMKALALAMQDKIKRKLAIIDQANNALINTEDIKEQRRLVSEAERQLTAIDLGITGGGSGGGVEVKLPGNRSVFFENQSKADAFKKEYELKTKTKLK